MVPYLKSCPDNFYGGIPVKLGKPRGKEKRERKKKKKKQMRVNILHQSWERLFLQTVGMFYSWVLFSVPTKLKFVPHWFSMTLQNVKPKLKKLNVFLLKQQLN